MERLQIFLYLKTCFSLLKFTTLPTPCFLLRDTSLSLLDKFPGNSSVLNQEQCKTAMVCLHWIDLFGPVWYLLCHLSSGAYALRDTTIKYRCEGGGPCKIMSSRNYLTHCKSMPLEFYCFCHLISMYIIYLRSVYAQASLFVNKLANLMGSGWKNKS